MCGRWGRRPELRQLEAEDAAGENAKITLATSTACDVIIRPAFRTCNVFGSSAALSLRFAAGMGSRAFSQLMSVPCLREGLVQRAVVE